MTGTLRADSTIVGDGTIERTGEVAAEIMMK
jgi:hypothetical protein